MATNEAAERLRERLTDDSERRLLGQAMEAERRATVERIRAAVAARKAYYSPAEIQVYLLAILDEEAQR